MTNESRTRVVALLLEPGDPEAPSRDVSLWLSGELGDDPAGLLIEELRARDA